jgi:hypothetical protein
MKFVAMPGSAIWAGRPNRQSALALCLFCSYNIYENLLKCHSKAKLKLCHPGLGTSPVLYLSSS